MLDRLSSGIKDALRKLTNAGYVDRKIVEDLSSDIYKALVSADVNVKLAQQITDEIKNRAANEKPPKGLTPKEHVIKIVYDELVKFVGEKTDLMLKPGRIMFVGLFAAGKTTSIGKLAKFYQKRGLRPALIGCDVHRPAAMDQLSQLAEQIHVPCYAPKDTKDPIEIIKNGIVKHKKYDIIIIDASGRSSLDEELAKELKALAEEAKPDEVLLTIPADLGQAAGEQAEGFKKLVGITGVFLTKMDGTARGGGALTSCAVTGAPIKFIGIGEKMDAIEVFDPERFISRLIGFGDMQGLLEKAKEAEFKPETAKKIMSGKFNMEEFYDQLKSMQKMGSMNNMMNMIPGASMMKMPKGFDAGQQENKMKKWAIIIQSMTTKEKQDPKLINPSRVKRIAKGSGTSEADVRELMKTYEQMKKVMKMFSGRGGGMLGKMMKRFKGFKL
ncbi:MAG: signal recognition particle protein [Candidatus Aenigmarchaeota archaeon]|nr:signal recognition particle protein [Candidatus Aenigmarchaeota archaeon]